MHALVIENATRVQSEGEGEIGEREGTRLVRGEVGRRALERDDHRVRRRARADGGRPLLDRLHRVLDLVQTPRRAVHGHVRVVLRAIHFGDGGRREGGVDCSLSLWLQLSLSSSRQRGVPQ